MTGSGPLLRAPLVAASGRVIVTSSSASTAPQAALDLEDLNSERSYRAFTAYARSKLANVLFASELARRWAVDDVSAATIRSSMHSSTSRARFEMRRRRDRVLWMSRASVGGFD